MLQGGRSPQHGKEVDTNDEGSLDQLASNLTKDTGITQSSSQVFTKYAASPQFVCVHSLVQSNTGVCSIKIFVNGSLYCTVEPVWP